MKLVFSRRPEQVSLLGRAAAGNAGDARAFVPEDVLAAVQEQVAQTLQRERDQMGTATAAFTRAAEELNKLCGQLREAAQREVVALALDIAGKVIEAEIDAGRYRIGDIVTEALSGLDLAGEVVVRVHPQDFAAADAFLGERESDSGAASVRVTADAQLSPGDCVVETSFESVDACIRSKFEYAVARLTETEGIS